MLNKQWIGASEQEQIDLLLAARQLILHHKWGYGKKIQRMKKSNERHCESSIVVIVKCSECNALYLLHALPSPA